MFRAHSGFAIVRRACAQQVFLHLSKLVQLVLSSLKSDRPPLETESKGLIPPSRLFICGIDDERLFLHGSNSNRGMTTKYNFLHVQRSLS
jgi:hypothetical protein